MHNQIALPIKSINHTSPPFPCTAILFSKVPGNTAYEIIRFQTQRQLDHTRVNTVAAVRVLLHTEDLADVPLEVLRQILNTSRPDFPVGAFPDNTETRERVVALAKESATPYEDLTMSENATGTTAAATPTNSTEAKALEKKAAAEKKAQEKEAAKKARVEARANGVIGTIKSMIDTKAGATANEVLDALTKKFPDRTRDGMSSTVKIQFSRLQKSTGREIHNANIEGRGRVYKFKDQGDVPGKIVAAASPAGSSEPATSPAAGQPSDSAVATTPAVTTSATGAPATQVAGQGGGAAPLASGTPAKAAGGKAGGKR